MSNFDWNQARAFWVTAEEGSLTRAARKLGLTQPTLSRQVAALEERLSLTLFERVGKSLVLTESGLELLGHVRAMGAAAEDMSLSATGRMQDVGGRVSVSASDGFSAYFMPRIAEQIRNEAPQVTLEIVSSNALSDLRRREADIALRHVRPEQRDLFAKLACETKAHLYASRGWVEINGFPGSPDDLANADFIGLDPAGRFLRFLFDKGLPVTAENFRLVSENSVVSWELARRGLGITGQVRELADGYSDMVPILPETVWFDVPVWLVTHRELRTSRRIRVVFDILARELRRLTSAEGRVPANP